MLSFVCVIWQWTPRLSDGTVFPERIWQWSLATVQQRGTSQFAPSFSADSAVKRHIFSPRLGRENQHDLRQTGTRRWWTKHWKMSSKSGTLRKGSASTTSGNKSPPKKLTKKEKKRLAELSMWTPSSIISQPVNSDNEHYSHHCSLPIVILFHTSI